MRVWKSVETFRILKNLRDLSGSILSLHSPTANRQLTSSNRNVEIVHSLEFNVAYIAPPSSTLIPPQRKPTSSSRVQFLTTVPDKSPQETASSQHQTPPPPSSNTTMDRNMSDLLKWSLENSTPSTTTPTPSANPTETTTTTALANPSPFTSPTAYSTHHPPPPPPHPTPSRPLDPTLLTALFGGPSDADLMKAALTTILSPTTPLTAKLTALDNLEQLVEQIDNANALAPLGLWTPLRALLASEEGDGAVRRMAAWCVGTAVQNNVGAQEAALRVGVAPALVGMCVGEGREEVRRKALYAVSSLVRNFQAGADEVVGCLPEGVRAEVGGRVDAGDMEAVDELLGRLRARA